MRGERCIKSVEVRWYVLRGGEDTIGEGYEEVRMVSSRVSGG
jgi:hypothetical protein